MKKRTPEQKKEFREWFRRWFGGGYGSPLADRCRTQGVENEQGIFTVGSANEPSVEEWLASLSPEQREQYEKDKARAKSMRNRKNDGAAGLG
jgi:hypothetical protein